MVTACVVLVYNYNAVQCNTKLILAGSPSALRALRQGPFRCYHFWLLPACQNDDSSHLPYPNLWTYVLSSSSAPQHWPTTQSAVSAWDCAPQSTSHTPAKEDKLKNIAAQRHESTGLLSSGIPIFGLFWHFGLQLTFLLCERLGGSRTSTWLYMSGSVYCI